MATATEPALQSRSDFELEDTEGSRFNLSDYWTKSLIVLVFLRHYGCTFCREQIAQLRSDYSGIVACPAAQVICIGHG